MNRMHGIEPFVDGCVRCQSTAYSGSVARRDMAWFTKLSAIWRSCHTAGFENLSSSLQKAELERYELIETGTVESETLELYGFLKIMAALLEKCAFSSTYSLWRHKLYALPAAAVPAYRAVKTTVSCMGCEMPAECKWKQSWEGNSIGLAFWLLYRYFYTYCLYRWTTGKAVPASNEKKINAGAFMTLPLLYREEFQLKGILLLFLLYSNWGKHVDISFKKCYIIVYSVTIFIVSRIWKVNFWKGHKHEQQEKLFDTVVAHAKNSGFVFQDPNLSAVCPIRDFGPWESNWRKI